MHLYMHTISTWMGVFALHLGHKIIFQMSSKMALKMFNTTFFDHNLQTES